MDIEGTMQFILDQQAQFSSDVARIHSILEGVTAAQERTSEILATLAQRQVTTEETTQSLAERQNKAEQVSLKLEQTMLSMAERQHKTEQTILEVGQTLLDVANAQERTNDILVTLADRRVVFEEAFEEARVATEEAMGRLAARQATTAENLNVLLLTVERHIANHH